jgi:outer membrane immunogenic protein
MSVLRFGAAAVAAAVLGMSAASAADLGGPRYGSIKDEPVYEKPFSWTGFYIGAHGGYAWGEFEDEGNPAADPKRIKGGFGGAQIGYNYQRPNNIVLGIEADISIGGPGKDWLGHKISGNQHDPYFGSDEVEWFGTVRARAGYAMGRFLPYVTGGVIFGENKHSLGCDRSVAPGGSTGCRAGEFETSDSKLSVGWVVGAGVEYALRDNWTIKAEYLYADIGTGKVDLVDPNYPNIQRDFDGHMNLVRAGINYKF